MAPASRIGAIASRTSLHTTPRFSYTCLQCRLLSYRAAQKSNLSNKHLPSRRHASGFINTEKWRKKIWGSENPPGQEDPYGAPGALDQRRREQRVEDPEQSAKEVETSVEDPDDVEGDVTPRGPHYKRATTWEGLERVGYRNWGKEQFDEEYPFEGFMDPKLESREKIITAVHRALVEVFALKQADFPLVMDYDAGDVFLDDVDDFLLRLAKEARFEIDATGEGRLVLEDEELQGFIVGSITPREEAEEEDEASEGNIQYVEEREEERDLIEGENSERLTQKEVEDAGRLDTSSPAIEPQVVEIESPAELETAGQPVTDEVPNPSSIPDHLLLPVDNNWRNVSLKDQEVKFAVFKRVMQLTGIRIPDPEIANLTNPKLLLSHLAKKPKPKKLAEKLLANEMAGLPNVQIWERRYTPIHREKEIGRWKVIEQELKKRGLPATGDRIGRSEAPKV